jgi:hypothetical protein
MAIASFDLLIPNLFVGLTKGARGLGDHGRRFRQLGYRIFRLEPTFLLDKGGKCNPDLVLSSSKISSTLILEWTNATSVHEDKREQFRRYAKVTSRDVVEELAVPRMEGGIFDIAVVVSTDAVDSFKRFLTDNGLPLVLLEFARKDEKFRLRRVSGRFKEAETGRFFSKTLVLDRIPLRYVPFSLANILPGELVTHIVSHMLSLMTRGSTQFTIDEFCSGFVYVWDTIAREKRAEISRATKRILGALAQHSAGRELLLRQQNPPNSPRWELLLSRASGTQIRGLRNRLSEFIAEVKGHAFQLELFDDVDSLEIRYPRAKPHEDSPTK